MKKTDEAKLNMSVEIIRNLKPATRYGNMSSSERENLSPSEAACYEAALKIVADYLKA